jgi:hypothetical protein
LLFSFFKWRNSKEKKNSQKPSKIGVWKDEMLKTRRILVYSKERKNKRINTRTYTIIHTVDGLLLLQKSMPCLLCYDFLTVGDSLLSPPPPSFSTCTHRLRIKKSFFPTSCGMRTLERKKQIDFKEE